MKIIRSRRRTISVEIRPDGEVWVRAPYRASRASIARFVRNHEDWILRHRAKVLARAEKAAWEREESWVVTRS